MQCIIYVYNVNNSAIFVCISFKTFYIRCHLSEKNKIKRVQWRAYIYYCITTKCPHAITSDFPRILCKYIMYIFYRNNNMIALWKIPERNIIYDVCHSIPLTAGDHFPTTTIWWPYVISTIQWYAWNILLKKNNNTY